MTGQLDMFSRPAPAASADDRPLCPRCGQRFYVQAHVARRLANATPGALKDACTLCIENVPAEVIGRARRGLFGDRKGRS